MREWKNNKLKADIIVSELLGSFGDNELSPECLYDAQHLFKEDAIRYSEINLKTTFFENFEFLFYIMS